MTLTLGTRLGPYEVQSAIGTGGMGEVYKAKDTRLDRTVAIKVLPAEVSADPDRRVRFEREARTIAGLNHPHICALFDVGETVLPGPQPLGPSPVSVSFLVMEHLTGESLASRLAKGPLPLDEALEVGIQIADALAAAHRQGVIHRDLKPGNVMLTRTGAKLLDFGLAKLRAPVAALGPDFSSIPTQAAPETAKGTILGTLAYMAPEQLEGKEADPHSDLFSFGAVLYEMLAGRRAFEGTSPASVISAVMSSQPPLLSTLQPLAPPVLERLVRQCLAKTADDRPDSAHDVANDLRWLREASSAGATPSVQPGSGRALRMVLLGAAGVVVFVAGVGLMWLLRPAVPASRPLRATVDVLPAEELNAGSALFSYTPGGSRTALAWSPDGQALVFVGRRAGVQQLYLRRLETGETSPLAGTEDAQAPAVSPDGQWVAFWANGAIRKVPFAGGPAMDVAPGISPPWGLIWDEAGGVYFGRDDGRIWAVAAGGTPTPVTTVSEGELAHTLPWLLPGGRVLLYTVRKRSFSWGDEQVVAQTLASGRRAVLLTNAADARYLPTGHLVFLRQGVLFAVAFDPEYLECRGPGTAVLDDVTQALTGYSSTQITGAGHFAVAPTGTLAYVPGGVMPFRDSTLVSVDRTGRVTLLGAPAWPYTPALRLSPDGRRLAVETWTLTARPLWLYDLDRRGTPTPLTVDGENRAARWSPDGGRLMFQRLKDGRYSLAALAADGTVPVPQLLLAMELVPSSVTPDRRQVAGVAHGDVVIVTLGDGTASVEPWHQTPYMERWPEFSPDGQWLAYGSDFSGRDEVYVEPYPGPGPRTPVSADGGRDPAWNPNGRELFYTSPGASAGKYRMMAVDFSASPVPRVGTARELFEFDSSNLRFMGGPDRTYDVGPDGRRFYVTRYVPQAPTPPVTHVNLITNWFEELKAKVPLK